MSENIHIETHLSKAEKYSALLPQLKALTEGEPDSLANIGNIIAGLKDTFSFFWIGLYFVKPSPKGEELVLGRFRDLLLAREFRKGKVFVVLHGRIQKRS